MPERWDRERAALINAGARVRRLPPLGKSSLLRIALTWPVDDRRIRLRAVFPQSYPWFPPEVHAADPLPCLVRHRNVATGSLCLLADPAESWHPGTLLAELLAQQLPLIIASNELPDPRLIEVPEPEGARTFTSATPGFALLIDSTNCRAPRRRRPQPPHPRADHVPPAHASRRVAT